MKNCVKRHTRASGYSLLELAVAMVVIGGLAVLLFRVVPNLRTVPALAKASASTLNQAEAALNGFVIANGRLPCPDSSSDNLGLEDCSATSVTGWLPVKTLGLSLSEKVRYGVYRSANATPALDSDLASLVNRYQPHLPGALPTVPNTETLAYALPLERKNGLDFCLGLRNVNASGGTVLTAGSKNIRIAYGLALAGGGVAPSFEGLNTVANKFELASTAKSATYDDETRTLGSGELFTRLGCANKMSAVHAAAMATHAAVDLDRVAKQYYQFRDFVVGVKEVDLAMDITGIAMASTDLAIALAGLAIGVAGGFESFGDFLGVVLATAAIPLATYALADAIISKQKGEEDWALAKAQRTAAENFRNQTYQDVGTVLSRLKVLDEQGLQP